MVTISLEYQITDAENDILKFLKKNANKMAQEINELLAKDQLYHAKEICISAVDAFYGAYTPLAYQRKYSLYDAFDVGIRNSDTFTFQIGDEMMSAHHQPNEYVFDVTFMNGYHGGPIWRTPIPYYTEILGPAMKSESPWSNIITNWTNYLHGEYQTNKRLFANQIGAKYASKF